jgi:SMI1 / KNR4 family (SUKH-1)
MEMRWQNLLDRTEVTEGETLSPCTKAEMLEVEAGLGVTLPHDYKTFCQIFGGGQLGDVYIHRLDRRHLDPYADGNKETIVEYREVIELFDIQILDIVDRIVNTGFCFGTVGGVPLYFYFDLQTYSSVDESCDIYMISFDERFGFYMLGRNFFVFVNNFVLGTNANDILGLIQNDSIKIAENRESLLHSLNESPKIFIPDPPWEELAGNID